jgi:hypothetical protein
MVVLAAGLMAGPVGARVGVPVAGLMAGPVGARVGVPVAGPVVDQVVVLMDGVIPMAGPVVVPAVALITGLAIGAILAAGLTVAPIWTGDAEGRTQRVRAPGAGWRGVEPVA